MEEYVCHTMNSPTYPFIKAEYLITFLKSLDFNKNVMKKNSSLKCWYTFLQ
jgi:hypothetical protein